MERRLLRGRGRRRCERIRVRLEKYLRGELSLLLLIVGAPKHVSSKHGSVVAVVVVAAAIVIAVKDHVGEHGVHLLCLNGGYLRVGVRW